MATNVNVYEAMFILDSNRYGRNPESVVGQIPKMVEEANGELLVSRLWEERRLAYPIKGHRKGTYWLTYFRINGAEIAGMKRKCEVSETILRALFLKVDPRIVDAMIAHAQAGPVSSAPSVADSEPIVDAIDDLEVEEVDDIEESDDEEKD